MGGLPDDFRRRTAHSEVMRTKPQTLAPTRITRRCYVAEVNIRVTASEIAWIGNSLHAACLRLRDSGAPPEVLSAAYVSTDGRLVCIVDAGCLEDVHRLFGVALLPPARVVAAAVVTMHAAHRTASS